MRTSNKGKVEIIGHEGVCLSKYKDSVGVWTIGIGATKSEIPDLAVWPKDKTLSMQEVFDLFSKSLVKYEDAINKSLKREIPQYQFDALVSWCYNVGTGYTRPSLNSKREVIREKATVLRLIDRGASGQELYDALLMFRKPPEILGRRTKEAVLLSTGKYSNDGKALLFPVSSNGYPIYSKGVKINVWEYIEHTSEVPLSPPEVLEEDIPSLLKKIINIFKGYL